ncbi:phosphonate transport system substrate-binding protein [endosymbiont of unidentified scaly snail isolate Monju]|nr:phosphonate transport system substrate-binding protein [endosymbiont of unidentified scaly snail isolate Monju]
MLALVLYSTNVLAARCTETHPCLFGVFPHTGTAQLRDTYSVVAEDLSLTLDTPVHLASGPVGGGFRKMLDQGEWDIALVGPGNFILHAQPAGYLPIASTGRQIIYQLTTLAERQIRTPKQLRGHRLGTMLPDSSTWLVTMDLLEQYHLAPARDVEIVHFSSQRGCLHALVIGRVEACVLARPIFRILQQQYQARFLILAETPEYAGPLYVVHPNLSESLRQRIADYLQSRPGTGPVNLSALDPYREIVRRLGRLSP